ncbi:MAG: biopolymer transporter ExbD [Verrucomicrobiota bacterium]
MASSSGGQDGEVGMQIAPLLDVLFVLLLFFMVNAGLQQKEAELPITLPGPTEPVYGIDLKTPVRLSVLSDGRVLWEDAPIAPSTDRQLAALTAKLAELIRDHDDQPIIIAPEAETRHQRVIDVLAAAHQANVKNLAFGTLQR